MEYIDFIFDLLYLAQKRGLSKKKNMISAQFFTMFTFFLFSCGSSSMTQEEKIEFVQLPTLENRDEVKEEYLSSKSKEPRWFSIAAVGEVRGEITPLLGDEGAHDCPYYCTTEARAVACSLHMPLDGLRFKFRSLNTHSVRHHIYSYQSHSRNEGDK